MTRDEEERGRGILSPADRNYLMSNPDNYSRQAAHERQRAIRERVRNSLLDFTLLFQELPDELIEDVVESDVQPATRIPDAVAFFARSGDLADETIFPGLGADQPAFADFTDATERGLEQWLAQEKQMAADVTLDVDISNPQPVSEVVSAVENGNRPNDYNDLELGALLSQAGYSTDEVQRLLGELEDDTNDE